MMQAHAPHMVPCPMCGGTGAVPADQAAASAPPDVDAPPAAPPGAPPSAAPAPAPHAPPPAALLAALRGKGGHGGLAHGGHK